MLIALIVVAVIVLFAIFTYNRLVSLRQAWKRAFADIDVQLKQRQDLVPNLVETVKGYATHESSVFTAVTQARASAMRATTVGEKSAAEGVLTSALGNLMAVAENYPQLKANEQFNRLMDELSGTENRIATERMRYNQLVQDYNTSRRQFPGNITAKLFGFKDYPFFEAPPEAKEVPKVNFTK